MLRLAVFASDRLFQSTRAPSVQCRSALPPVALVAGGGEVVEMVRPARRECLNMVDDGPEQIEQWGTVPCPMGVIVGEVIGASQCPDFPFQKFHDRGEDDRALAPTAEPAVAPEHRDLKRFLDRPSACHSLASPIRGQLKTVPSVIHHRLIANNIAAMHRALVAAGIALIEEDGKGVGIRVMKR